MNAGWTDKAQVPLKVWAGFGMMCLGMFMAILDIQIVATSLPAIQSGLGIAPDQMSWVQTAYLIAEVIAIPLTGLLTRVMTMRWLFVAAVSGFTVASLGCALSQGFWPLVGWRIAQGFSGGTLIPAVFSAVFLLFPKHRQPLATTIAGVLAVLAPTLGPVAGGWITATYSWHWLFLVNVLPGILAGATAGALIRRPELRAGKRFGSWTGHRWRSWPWLLLPSRSVSRKHRAGAGRTRWCFVSSPWRSCRAGSSLSGPFRARHSGRGSPAHGGSEICGRLHPELPARDRPVRFGLSHAGLPGLRPRS